MTCHFVVLSKNIPEKIDALTLRAATVLEEGLWRFNNLMHIENAQLICCFHSRESQVLEFREQSQ